MTDNGIAFVGIIGGLVLVLIALSLALRGLGDRNCATTKFEDGSSITRCHVSH